MVEIFHSGEWNDVTTDVRTADPIAVTRGRGDERQTVSFGSCELTFDNRTGTYSNRNPSSPLFGLIGRNTPLRVRADTPTHDITDTFTRSSTNSWGTADDGGAYSHVWAGGSIDDFDVAAGVGTQVVSNANGYRLAYLSAVQAENINAVVTVGLPTNNVTGGSLEPANIAVRITAIETYYLFRVEYTTAEAIRASIYAPGGVQLVDELVFTSAGWTPGEDLKVRVLADGGQLKMRVWPAAGVEPSTWNAEVEDYTYLGPGAVGIRSGAATGNTNLPATFEYDDFSVSTWDILFIGEVSEWPQRWNIPGTDVWAPINAAGVLRRLNQGAKALESPIRRAMLNGSGSLLAYWALEDDAGATEAASLVAGSGPMVASGSSGSGVGVEFAKEVGRTNPQYTGFPILAIATKPMASFGKGGSLAGRALPGTQPQATRSWTVQFIGRVYAFIHTNNVVMLRWLTPGGSFVRWEVVARVADGGVDLIAYDTTGAATTLATTSISVVDNFAFRITVEQDGANIDTTYRVSRVTPAGDAGSQDTDTRAGTLAYPTSFFVNPNQEVIEAEAIPGSPNITNDLIVSHLSVWDGIGPAMTAGGYTGPWAGWPGETAGRRIERLCEEEGIPFSGVGDLDATARVGPQGIDTLVNLLNQAATADQGILFELRAELGLGYRTLGSLQNQTPVELDYSAGHIAPPLDPTDDDQAIHNDVTVTRPNGGSTRATLATGPLSTMAPPDGVGTYDRGAIDAHVESDTQLPDLAHWALHMGTWDEARYPAISVNLAAPVWVSDAGLAIDVTRLDTGDLLSIDNVPEWVPPGPIVAMVQGHRLRLETHQTLITWNATPGGPYTVGVLDDDARGKLDTEGCVLATAVDDNDTTFEVATTSGPLWTEDDAEFPFDWPIAGERVTVTDITHTAITYVAVGTVNHADNANVTPGLPAGRQAGDGLICLAAIRNSGSGTPNTPTGFEILRRPDGFPVFEASSNVQLFGRIATNTAADQPTVSFTGGVAGATCSAQMIAIRGDFNDIDALVVAAASALNVSAQNIAYPGLVVPWDNCLILYCGWKQDDWTSVTSPGTEIGEPDTPTGDDQGLVWAYQIQTTKAAIAAGSFTVTGGTSQISRGAVLAIRYDVQSATVTRSVNGVVKSHASGTEVRLWQPHVLAL